MIGSTLFSKLIDNGFNNIITKNSQDLDLKNQSLTNQFILDIKPEYIYLVAAKVGGIQANIDNPATYLYQNLMIQSMSLNRQKELK